jgi:protein-tyrosine kinase
MERLQSALDKARAQRQGAEPAAAAGTGPRPEPAAASPEAREGIWQAIPCLDPDPALLIRHRVFTLASGRSATEFDILRTKLQLMMRKNGWKRLAVTSPTPACGKTTTACNLAIGFTRQPQVRAALIELDLHRPTCAHVLGFTPPADITAFLRGETPLAEAAVRFVDNVAVLAATGPSPDPTAVLLDRRTQEALAGFEATCAPDIVIFDVPPLLTSDDTRAFLNEVDCAILVARAEVTTVAQINQSEREIAEHTNFVGVVLNQCRLLAGSEHDISYY